MMLNPDFQVLGVISGYNKLSSFAR